MAAGGFDELERLEQDHEEAGRTHSEVEELYRSWIASCTLSESNSRRLLTATGRLRDLYKAHIQVEDTVVFPKAAQVLDPGALVAIGQEFRQRRQKPDAHGFSREQQTSGPDGNT
jgi:hemerythrin-like domain-containing protein